MVITEDIEGVECELSHEPVECFDTLSAKVGDKRVFAYIVSDTYGDYDNLVGEDMGRLVDFRNRRRDETEGYLALGRTSDGDPDFETVYDKHTSEFFTRYKRLLKCKYTDVTIADAFDCSVAEIDDEIEERIMRNAYAYQDLPFENDVDAVLKGMWDEPEYFTGEPYAQLLDCYAHSNEWWSLSGHGMQCRWDTSRGAGVWIPDKYCLEDIHKSGDLDAVAFIKENPLHGKKYVLYRVEWVESQKYVLHEVKTADNYRELVGEREALRKNRSCNTEWQREWGRQHRAESLCKSFLETHNAIINGDVWGIVCEVFDENGTQVDEESCWNFVGSEYAQQAMEEEFFDPTVNRHKRELFKSLGGEIHPSWYTAPYWPDTQTCSHKKFDSLDDALKFLEEQRDTATTTQES